MKLFLLKREVTDYDQYDSFVIRAETEDEARKIAGDTARDRTTSEWLASDKSTCEELTLEGEPGVVIGSYNSG